MMRLCAFLLVAALGVGCATTKPNPEQSREQQAESAPAAEEKRIEPQKGPILTQSYEKIGRVALVNPTARFVILSFPIGEVAMADQRLN
ncbi:MAG: hypothetical protein ACK4UN_05440, partial [Limisphaerales bacterium]